MTTDAQMGAKPLCLEPHPIGGFDCIKKRGHDKAHWFQAMWSSKDEAIAEYRAYLQEELSGLSADLTIELARARRAEWDGSSL